MFIFSSLLLFQDLIATLAIAIAWVVLAAATQGRTQESDERISCGCRKPSIASDAHMQTVALSRCRRWLRRPVRTSAMSRLGRFSARRKAHAPKWLVDRLMAICVHAALATVSLNGFTELSNLTRTIRSAGSACIAVHDILQTNELRQCSKVRFGDLSYEGAKRNADVREFYPG